MSTTMSEPMNEGKLHEFVMKAVGEMGAAMNAALILVGDKLGLYKGMAGAGPMTPAELAAKTGTYERYVREWLAAQAAGGFVTHNAVAGRYTLPPEQAFAMADENSPVFLPGFFDVVEACVKDVPKITEAFRSGKGVGWHEHDVSLFTGTERFFRPNYRAHLIKEWIPALGDAEAKLKAGASVADVGCGLGTSTILMAQAYPKSKFVGFDYHQRSIELARESATKAGVSARVKFEVAKAKDFPGKAYDLVAFFDCLHDMGDPEGAARASVARAEWHLDDRRAVRARQARRQFEPHWTCLFRSFHHALYPGFALAGGRPRTRRPGGGRSFFGNHEVRWLYPCSPRY